MQVLVKCERCNKEGIIPDNLFVHHKCSHCEGSTPDTEEFWLDPEEELDFYSPQERRS